MKEKEKILRFYNYSHPLMSTEILSLQGDKYLTALSFKWEMTTDYERADVVIWDGVLGPRHNPFAEQILKDIRETKILLLVGEAESLFRSHPLVELVDDSERLVHAGSWNLLPEDLLAAFEKCFEKLKHV